MGGVASGSRPRPRPRPRPGSPPSLPPLPRAPLLASRASARHALQADRTALGAPG
ncbi:hypothetical protein ACP4OV_020229 [Aristida adscensionis]